MEFNKKLQELRKQKGITQEELAERLFVSRTAISKWESGRGYPTIESLKAIAKFFSVTVDELLSSDELLSVAEEDAKQTKSRYHDMIFGLLDCSMATFLFLPLFGQTNGEIISEVSLLSLTEVSCWLKAVYFTLIITTIICGITALALQNSRIKFWTQNKRLISLLLNTSTTLIFIISMQPYAAVLAFIFLIIKALMVVKNPMIR